MLRNRSDAADRSRGSAEAKGYGRHRNRDFVPSNFISIAINDGRQTTIYIPEQTELDINISLRDQWRTTACSPTSETLSKFVRLKLLSYRIVQNDPSALGLLRFQPLHLRNRSFEASVWNKTEPERKILRSFKPERHTMNDFTTPKVRNVPRRSELPLRPPSPASRAPAGAARPA